MQNFKMCFLWKLAMHILKQPELHLYHLGVMQVDNKGRIILLVGYQYR